MADWSRQQIDNANTIIRVGRQMGMDERDIQIALMTAMQESSLENLSYGSGSSIGLFQQIDSWGTFEQRHDPVWAATAFYNALRGVSDRDKMSLTEAAQAVQRSAYPDAYAKWANDAAALLKGRNLQGGELPSSIGQTAPALGMPAPEPAPVTPPAPAADASVAAPSTAAQSAVKLTDALQTPGVGQYSAPTSFSNPATEVGMPTIPTLGAPGSPSHGSLGGNLSDGWRGQVVSEARKLLGIPYVWGGESLQGFDCSGLVQYVYKQLGLNLPRISYQQATYGNRIGLDALKPGDLVAWDLNSRNNGADHIAIYIGHGMIIEAPRPGLSVQISHLYDQDRAWGVRMTD